ncbi:MAG: carbohydrate-binding protein [Chitinivibrionales bacterium]|nr:carbohydrate-binding protein [Chitinivibrionales bacterium]
MDVDAMNHRHRSGTMKTTLACLATTLTLATVSAQTWTTVADLNEARGEHSNAVYGGKIYCMTGFQQVFSTTFHPEVFDPSTNTWSTLTVPAHVAAGGVWNLNHVTAGSSVYGSEIWLCGGKYGASGYTTDVWVYDAANDTWRAGPSLPEITWGAPSVVIGDELHVLGGYRTNSDAATYHFVLDLTDDPAGWRTEPALPERFGHMAAVALNGRIITIGGERDHAGHVGESGIVQVYDPSTNTWDLSWPDCPEARTHHEWATFVYDGEVWCVSGVDTDRSPIGQNAIYVLNPTSKQWRRYPVDLPHRYVSPGAKVIDDTLYVFGGGYDTWWPAKTTTIALSLVDEPGPSPEVIDAFSTIEAETFTAQSGVGIYRDDSQIGNIQDGDWVKYAHVDFGSGASSVTIRAACDAAGGTVSLRLDGVDGTEVGSIAVTSTGGWTTYEELQATLSTAVTDTHDLYLVFLGSGQYLMDIDWLVFAAQGTTHAEPAHSPAISRPVAMVPVAGGVLLRSASSGTAARVTDLRGRAIPVLMRATPQRVFLSTEHLSPGPFLLVFPESALGN